MAYTGNTGENVSSVDIVVNDTTTDTLESFVENYLINFNIPSISNDKTLTTGLKSVDDLLNFDGNKDRIFEQYTLEEATKYLSGSKDLVKLGTIIRVPKENLQKEILPNAGNLAVNLVNAKLGMSPAILKIFQDKEYVPIQLKDEDSVGNTFLGNAYRIHNNVSVWIYCKALGKTEDKGRMINVTPFLETLTTNVSEGGGNFMMSIAPITCEYDEQEGWVITKDTYTEYAYNDSISTLVRDSLLYEKDGDFKQKKFFFHHLIQPNDLVFIQFETLKNEEKIRNFDPQLISSQNNFFPNGSPAGHFYDMIGLVDISQKKYRPENSNVTIDISGRDLMKIIIDDGCYIYPLDYARGFDPNKGQAIQRVLGKELYFFKSFVDVSVGYLINFVMNLLSNIAVIKDETLFSGWGDRRSYRYDIIQASSKKLSETPITNDKPTLSDTLEKKQTSQAKSAVDRGQINKDDDVIKKPAEGIWQIVKLSIDPAVSKLRLVDTSITDYQGSLLNYINKVCQKPFVEFRGDTVGDQYHFSVVRPPFTQDLFLDAFDKQGQLEISEDQLLEEDLSFDDAEIYSWYRIRPSGSGLDKSVGDYIASELTAWFEEFAELYGAKSYDVSTIYSQIYNLNAAKQEELITQFKKDLVYLIESTIYIPFTRKGTIIICPPDRRIKRGMVIRHKGTEELFYVDGVSNSASIGGSSVERSTTLTVSRGMIERYARNRVSDTNKDVISYFNLVDFNLDLAKDTSKTAASNFSTNKDVLNFFLKRKQFIDKYTVSDKDFPNKAK